MTSLHGSGVRRTLRFRAFDPAADVGRPCHRQPVGRRRAGHPQGEPGEGPAVHGDVAEEVGGHGIADGVAGRRVRPAEPPGERVEPEEDRGEVGREVPGEVVIPGMGQLVGEDRPQVGPPAGPARPLRRAGGPVARSRPGRARTTSADGRRGPPATAQPRGDRAALLDDPVRGVRRPPHDPGQAPGAQDQPRQQDGDSGRARPPAATATTCRRPPSGPPRLGRSDRPVDRSVRGTSRPTGESRSGSCRPIRDRD